MESTAENQRRFVESLAAASSDHAKTEDPLVAKLIVRTSSDGASCLTADKPDFEIGHRVRVHGLLSAAHYNGKVGVISTAVDLHSGRYGVTLECGSGRLHIKSSNFSTYSLASPATINPSPPLTTATIKLSPGTLHVVTLKASPEALVETLPYIPPQLGAASPSLPLQLCQPITPFSVTSRSLPSSIDTSRSIYLYEGTSFCLAGLN